MNLNVQVLVAILFKCLDRAAKDCRYGLIT